jgi:hypothetical protein
MKALKLALCVAVVACAMAAAPISYYAVMTGSQEAPPNASPGAGFALVTIDLEANLLEVSANFSNLLAPTTAAHIHAPTAIACAGLPEPLPAACTTAPTGTAGVATMTPSFLNFPLGLTSGTMQPTLFDLTLASSFNNNFLSGSTAEEKAQALAQALAEGRAYFNIHTSPALGGFGGGEIRGFLTPVPEPASSLACAGGLALLFIILRRRQN